MARLITDGAESGDTLRLDINTNAVSVVAAARLTGNYSYSCQGNAIRTGTYLLDSALTEFYMRFAFYKTNGPANNSSIIRWDNGAIEAGSFRVDSFAPATVSIYDGTTLRATSGVLVFNIGEWHVFEIRVKLGTTPNGIFQVKYDGTLIIDYAGTTNNQAQITRVSFIGIGGNNTDTYFDDFAINDTTGVVDNSWCGDGGVLAALVPTGVGTYSDLTASAGNAYQCVDDVPQNGDTDYIYSSTVGHKSTFAMSNLPALLAGASIARVWTEIVARETAAVGAKIATFIRSGATDIQGSDQTLTLAYGRFIEGEHIVDPNTAAPWSEAGVNAIEAGVRTR